MVATISQRDLVRVDQVTDLLKKREYIVRQLVTFSKQLNGIQRLLGQGHQNCRCDFLISRNGTGRDGHCASPSLSSKKQMSPSHWELPFRIQSDG
jgi:hypothetical protein